MMITRKQLHTLKTNHVNQMASTEADGESIDLVPVVKLFDPCGNGTWLLTEYDESTGRAFGLCDMGCPELGYVLLADLERHTGPLGIGIERDLSFVPNGTLSEYADRARHDQTIWA